MTNRILRRLMDKRAQLWRSVAVETDGVTSAQFQLVKEGIPCKVSQTGTGHTILKKGDGEDLVTIGQELKGFLEWDEDIRSGDRLAVELCGETAMLQVGEVFDYPGSHRECRLSRVQTV